MIEGTSREDLFTLIWFGLLFGNVIGCKLGLELDPPDSSSLGPVFVSFLGSVLTLILGLELGITRGFTR